jgi:hypothetical protein
MNLYDELVSYMLITCMYGVCTWTCNKITCLTCYVDSMNIWTYLWCGRCHVICMHVCIYLICLMYLMLYACMYASIRYVWYFWCYMHACMYLFSMFDVFVDICIYWMCLRLYICIYNPVILQPVVDPVLNFHGKHGWTSRYLFRRTLLNFSL